MSAVTEQIKDNNNREELFRLYDIPEFRQRETIIKFDSSFEWHRAELCQLFYQGVEWILETEIGNDWDCPELEKADACAFQSYNRVQTYPTTIHEIIVECEKMIVKARMEALAEYEDDPEEYLKYYKRNPQEKHPYGETELKTLRAWLKIDPFELHCFQQALKQKAIFDVEDRLLSMARGQDNGKDLAKTIEETFNTFMDKFCKRVQNEG